MTSQMYDEKEFWPIFFADLMRAERRVIICTPFVSTWQVKKMSKYVRMLRRKAVPLCILLQQTDAADDVSEYSDEQFDFESREFDLKVKLLRSYGAHVSLVPEIHGKLAFIDNRILWDGSLNILSPGRSRNHMRRSLFNSDDSAERFKKKFLQPCEECTLADTKYNIGSDSDYLLKFGHMIESRRTTLDLSRRQLALKCGLNRNHITRIENGSNMTLETVRKVANELGLEIMLIPQTHASLVVELLDRN